MDEVEGDWSLVLSFDTDHEEFVRGWEAATLYERCKADPGVAVEASVHSTNAEMILRIGEATRRSVIAQTTGNPCDDEGNEWLRVVFSAVSS